jgi:putative hydrolase of the HAD superfamily
VTETLFRTDRLKVIVFDVDGTLYRQAPLRRAMLFRLLRLTAAHPLEGWRTFRTLNAYRRAQEELRGESSGDLAQAQIKLASNRSRSDSASVIACVERWMEQEPLAVLPRCAHTGLVKFLHACKARGLRLAVLSDYPAAAKLDALEIAELFEMVLCAQAPEVGVFKPDPRGLLVALQRLGVNRDECLYVGDRADVDAAAAEAAGIRCVILTRDKASASATYTTVTGYPHLHNLLLGAPNVPPRGVISAESYR